jgi:hypothetical protein
MPVVDNAYLRRAAAGWNAATSQFQLRRSIQPVHIVLMKNKRIDRRRSSNVHMVVAEIHTHGSAGRRHQLFEFEAVAVAPVYGNRIGSVVDGREELAV